MAVLRPDQTQLTFGTEPAAGADQDKISTAVGGMASSTTFTAQVNPGDTSVTVSSGVSSFKVGDSIIIGGGTNHQVTAPTDDRTLSICQSEVRKIEHIDGNTLFMDRPFGFTHHTSDGTQANAISRFTVGPTGVATLNNKVITYVPGVYETVDTPDFTPMIEPRYFLGTNSKRNFTATYAGQHSYTGALNGCILLNGWPLRFAIGAEIPKEFGALISPTGPTLASSSFVGDIWIRVGSASHGMAVGDCVVVGYEASPTMNSIMEIRKIRTVPGSSRWIELETPLRYAHPTPTVNIRKWVASSSNYVEHHIVERVDLDSISMHLHMRDSDETAANDFDRRWIGGKVGAMSIAGEEGGLVTINWDSISFKDMIHNQARHAGTTRYDPTGTVTTDGVAMEPNMPGYAVMNDILEADIAFPTTQPYYFSEGTISIFGTEFARIRSFAISVNNNLDPRYYITRRYGSHRGPSELREQRREYTMTCTVALPDTKVSTDNTIDNATSIFKELLLEGKYNTTDMKGFNIGLKFIRGPNALASGAKDDAMYIDIPGLPIGLTSFGTPGSSNATGSALGNQGAFLRSAPHTIITEAPFQVACDFVFRSMAVVIRDQEPVYP